MNKTYSKYHNKKVVLEDGQVFDSRREYLYYCRLIEQNVPFDRQQKFILQEGYTLNGKKVQPIYYVCDFLIYTDDSRKEISQVVDVKSPATAKDKVFLLKKKLFDKIYSPLFISVVLD